MTIEIRDRSEWLEADGLGGYASGTATGRRTRRYHGLLTSAETPPGGRMVLVNGIEAWVDSGDGSTAVSSQRYAPGVVHPDGAERIESFVNDPWPTWTYALPDGTRLVKEVFVRRGMPATVVCFRLRGRKRRGVRLFVRPLLSGRSHHALHVRNDAFAFDAELDGDAVSWRPYSGVPAITAITSGRYDHGPDWYYDFLYEAERERGLPHVEDLASPGVFSFDLDEGPAVMIFSARGGREFGTSDARVAYRNLRDAERRRRRRLGDPVRRSAADFLVDRGKGRSVIAGYPWFADWGRDTFIALRGLCLAVGRFEDARRILLGWAGHLDGGMLPNRFPEEGSGPEFNSVDAALWFVLAAREFLEATLGRRGRPSRADRARLSEAIEEVIRSYRRGTRHGIGVDDDGLLLCGGDGSQITWMDARVDGVPVTSRAGKPVEVQALWMNALHAGSGEWLAELDRAQTSFEAKFWFEEGGYLHDVVDADRVPGRVDSSLRPNQILAAGGLPFRPLSLERARRVVDVVESRLLTPIGLRTLDPDDPAYEPRYRGGPSERDRSYHQGTVWPWLLGPFVDAWLSVRGDTDAAREEASARFLAPLREHLGSAGIGHVSEIADGDPPHRPGGCPFQAWSLGEYLRLEKRLNIGVRPQI